MELTPAQLDRASGVLVGCAIGDALGAPYEFQKPLPLAVMPEMKGGGLGPFAPGEWTDDTQMSTVVAHVAMTHDLTAPAGLDKVAAGFLAWRKSATDVGNQTRSVLYATNQSLREGSVLPQGQRRAAVSVGALMAEHARLLHQDTGKTAGNGSLMRTSAVALRYLNEGYKCWQAARLVSELTHHDPLAGDACAIWCELIRVAVLTGRALPLGTAIVRVMHDEDKDRSTQWLEWANQATSAGVKTSDFENNGYVVAALQAAYVAVRPLARLTWQDNPVTSQDVLHAYSEAVHAGNDTDTVAAIAGAYAGALSGLSGLPQEWREQVHGWAYQVQGEADAGYLSPLAIEVTKAAS